VGGIVLAGAIYCLHWRQSPKRVSLIPPHRRFRSVPWSGMELLLVLCIYFGSQLLIPLLLHALGIVHAAKDFSDFSISELQAISIVSMLTAPLVIAVSVRLLWEHSQTRPRHLGISRWRWRSSLCLGYLAFLMMTPTVLGISYLANYLIHLLGRKSIEHPLTRLGGPDASPLGCALMILQAMVAAPVLEEFVFRGVIQPWLAKRWWGGWSAIAAAITITLLQAPPDQEQWMPTAFVLVVGVLGFVYTLPRADEQWIRRSIIGTSLLFAMIHTNVWPSPMPLFVLALALGWVAHRTRNLMAPIVLHSLFNGVAAVVLLTGLFDQPNGNAEIPAETRPAAISTSTAVPGDWWPCRKYANAMALPSRGETTDEVTKPTSSPE
jgi:membrane protease YdiL (CAAX protease family)